MRTCPSCGSVAVYKNDEGYECTHCLHTAKAFPHAYNTAGRANTTQAFGQNHGRSFVARGAHGFYSSGMWHMPLPRAE